MRARIAGDTMRIAFPVELAAPMLPLLRAERAELQAVFGGEVEFVDTPPTSGSRWLVDLQPDLRHNALRWDDATCTLTSVIRDADGLGATLQMLHSLVTLEMDEITDAPTDDLTGASTRIEREIERGFPGFGIRNLTFAEVRSEPMTDPTIPGLERMVARLQDAHSAVRAHVPIFNPPYALSLREDGAVFRRVPSGSAAHTAGLRAGWRFVCDDPHGWIPRTGAPPHVHDLVAGRRALALNGVDERIFEAISPTGQLVQWTERSQPYQLSTLLQHEIEGEIVYVRLGNWIAGIGIEAELAAIIGSYQTGQTMVLDLRGNTGGNLLMAQQTRRCFLRERTCLGTIQFTCGDGTLADPVELWDEPPTEGIWPGDLIVLTDGLTYSASEDFLHGLQGLPHVTFVGEPSGGGSGRPRTLPIIPGWHLTLSTALTFDRNGHCIEGQGIPVDHIADPFVTDWRTMIRDIR